MSLHLFRGFASLFVCLAGMAAAAPAPPALYAAGTVRQALRLPDGSVIIAGYFTSVGEVPRAGVAKLAPDGQLDAAWAPPAISLGFASQAVALAASPDGSSVYIATSTQVAKVFATGGGASVPGFAAVVSGSVDGGNTGIRTLRADGSYLYVAGAFAYVNGVQRSAIARLGSSGALDATWNASANSTINAIEIDPVGGFVYLGGAFVTVNGLAHLRVARVQLSDGTGDATWTPSVASTSSGVLRIALSPARDSLVLSGNFSAVNGTPRAGLARLVSSSGALDGSWTPAVAGYGIEAIAAQDDFVYFAGNLQCCNQDQMTRVAATGSGSIDQAWLPAFDAPVHALLVGAGMTAYAFGEFGHAGAVPALGAAAIGAGGAASHVLPDFEIEASAIASASEPSGDLLLAGDFQKVDHTYREGLFRLQAATATLDPAFDPPRFGYGLGNGRLRAVAIDAASAAVYVGGTFDSVGGVAQGLVVRLDAITGAVAPGWTAVQSPGSVQAIAVDASFVYIGGAFQNVNGQPRSNLARLTPAGELDAQMQTAANGAVSRIALDGDDGAIYIAGTFLSPRTRVARLLRADGAFDPAWNPQFDWVIVGNDILDLELVGGNAVICMQASIPYGGGYVLVGDVVQIDSAGVATEVARFNQPVDDILGAADGGSIYLAGTFQTMYALDDFFAQTSHPNGLVQVSLRAGTFGKAESWTPAPPLTDGGTPGLARFGTGAAGVLLGSDIDAFGFARQGLALLELPPGDFLFKDGFGP